MAEERMNILNEAHGQNWAAYHSDCVSFARDLPDDSVDFSIYSPPFSNLFVYSDSEADMGNSVDDAEFMVHYGFLLRELFRATLPGRLSAVHCSDLPLTKWKDGMIGIKDLTGQIIKAHQDSGWVLHSRVTVWKSPVVEMTRTKALGLLYKQLQKDSGRSRQGMPDYVLVFRKPGDNPKPILQNPQSFPLERWQEWASPVWMDINQTNVLNVRQARAERDERHLCPLQLDLIERALILWSNAGDVVFSPFLGIGSEGVMSLKLGRKFIGTELKDTYFSQAVGYLRDAESNACDLFSATQAA